MNNSTAQYVEGKITGIEGQVPLADGSLGYTTDSVRYTIDVSINGALTTFKNQTPQVRLWGPLQVLDALRLKGCSVPGVIIGNDLRWHFYEPPALASCGAAPSAAVDPLIEPNRRGAFRTGIDLPPIDGNPGNAAGGSAGGPSTGPAGGGVDV